MSLGAGAQEVVRDFLMFSMIDQQRLALKLNPGMVFVNIFEKLKDRFLHGEPWLRKQTNFQVGLEGNFIWFNRIHVSRVV